jgi:hypothetical protein
MGDKGSRVYGHVGRICVAFREGEVLSYVQGEGNEALKV